MQMHERGVLARGARTAAPEQLVGGCLDRERRLAEQQLQQAILHEAERLLRREPQLALPVHAEDVQIRAALLGHQGALLPRVPRRHAHELGVAATRRLELAQPGPATSREVSLIGAGRGLGAARELRLQHVRRACASPKHAQEKAFGFGVRWWHLMAGSRIFHLGEPRRALCIESI